MVFADVSALLSMEGHGAYVWFSYGASALVLVSLVLEGGRRRRAAERRILALARRRGAADGRER